MNKPEPLTMMESTLANIVAAAIPFTAGALTAYMLLSPHPLHWGGITYLWFAALHNAVGQRK